MPLADTQAALDLLGRVGTGPARRLQNPGLTARERRDLLATLLVILSTGRGLMLSGGERFLDRALQTEVFLLGYLALYCQLGGEIPKQSSVELLIGGGGVEGEES